MPYTNSPRKGRSVRPLPALATGGSTSAETLIRDAHTALSNAGIGMSPSKVSRIVRQFKHRVEANGFTFGQFLANAVVMNAEQRRRVLADPAIARVISYADPTGEAAVANVIRANGGTG